MCPVHLRRAAIRITAIRFEQANGRIAVIQHGQRFSIGGRSASAVRNRDRKRQIARCRKTLCTSEGRLCIVHAVQRGTTVLLASLTVTDEMDGTTVGGTFSVSAQVLVPVSTPPL